VPDDGGVPTTRVPQASSTISVVRIASGFISIAPLSSCSWHPRRLPNMSGCGGTSLSPVARRSRAGWQLSRVLQKMLKLADTASLPGLGHILVDRNLRRRGGGSIDVALGRSPNDRCRTGPSGAAE